MEWIRQLNNCVIVEPKKNNISDCDYVLLLKYLRKIKEGLNNDIFEALDSDACLHFEYICDNTKKIRKYSRKIIELMKIYESDDNTK